MKIDLHIHTNASHDSDLSLSELKKHIDKVGLECIAITDHDTISNAVKFKQMNHPNLHVIVGSEITTDKGVHIIGLFLNKNVAKDDIFSVIKKIKKQGGLVVLPHPFRRDSGLFGVTKHTYTSDEIFKIISLCDIIEIGNSRCDRAHSVVTQNYFKSFEKPKCVGSDAHYGFNVGSTYCECPNTGKLKKDVLHCHAFHIVSQQHSTLLSRTIFKLASISKDSVIFKIIPKKNMVKYYEKTQKRIKELEARFARRKSHRF